jgi:hypothetical protein
MRSWCMEVSAAYDGQRNWIEKDVQCKLHFKSTRASEMCELSWQREVERLCRHMNCTIYKVVPWKGAE